MNGWSTEQAKMFVKSAKNSIGEAGWNYLSPEMREGLIAKEFARVMLGNANPAFAPVADLYREMVKLAALTCRTTEPHQKEESE